MTEPKIRDYLLGLIDAGELLRTDLVPNDKVRPYYKVVEMIEEGEFRIEPQHLISVCDDVLNKKIKPERLDQLAFILIGSDYFMWDPQNIEGEKVAQVLMEWNNPTLFYPLTIQNVNQWKTYLISGEREMSK